MAKQKTKKKATAGDIIRNIVMVIALAVFLYSAFQLVKIFWEYYQGTQEYKGLREFTMEVKEEAEQPPVPDTDVMEEQVVEEIEFPRKQVDFEALKAINEDIIGWIQVEAIDEIDYPLVHGEDNDWYLTHTFENNQNSAGSVFLDYENHADMMDRNSFIYGHNMRNGSMFGNLRKFHDKETYEKSRYIWVFTPNRDYRYEIFSYHVAGVYDDSFIKFYESEEEYKEYLERVASLSEYSTDVELTAKDKIITLSTCTGDDTTRFLVHAKLVNVLKPVDSPEAQ